MGPRNTCMTRSVNTGCSHSGVSPRQCPQNSLLAAVQIPREKHSPDDKMRRGAGLPARRPGLSFLPYPELTVPSETQRITRKHEENKIYFVILKQLLRL